MEPVGRVVEAGGGFDDALHHVELVVNGQLHRHPGPFGRGGRRRSAGAGIGAAG
ncbi:hypothetical protein [Hymenobacter cellulosilyticus]|uniref:hypothetical protein n=1 Tax=Hymenobacter cellulosilyticus TaxID=2932248 RepID=UPI0028802C2F|nr:hypothetical protein [Hymenobacter cellulosilyticus]